VIDHQSGATSGISCPFDANDKMSWQPHGELQPATRAKKPRYEVLGTMMNQHEPSRLFKMIVRFYYLKQI